MNLHRLDQLRVGAPLVVEVAALGLLLGCCCFSAAAHAGNSSKLEAKLRRDCESAWQAQLAQLDDLKVRWCEDVVAFYSPQVAKKKGKDRKTLQRFLHVWLSRHHQAAVAEFSLDAEYEPIASVLGHNSRYAFDVARNDPGHGFRLKQIAMAPTWPTDLSATDPAKQSDFLGVLAVPQVGLGNLTYTLSQMLDSPEFTLTSYVAEAGGRGRRMVATFRQQYVLLSGKPQGDPVEWRGVLDPEQDWAPVEWTVTSKTHVQKIRVEYQRGPAGLAFPREILRETIIPGTPQNSTTRWTIEAPTRFTGSTSAAYLSHYGLRDPAGWSIPWWGGIVFFTFLSGTACAAWMTAQRRR